MIKTILKQKKYRFFQKNTKIPLLLISNPVPQAFVSFTLKNIALKISFPFKYNDKNSMQIFKLTLKDLKEKFGGLLSLKTNSSTTHNTYYNFEIDYFLQTLTHEDFNENNVWYPSVALFYKDEKLLADTILCIEQIIIKKITLESTKKNIFSY